MAVGCFRDREGGTEGTNRCRLHLRRVGLAEQVSTIGSKPGQPSMTPASRIVPYDDRRVLVETDPPIMSPVLNNS